jgi:hypothetical protein
LKAGPASNATPDNSTKTRGQAGGTATPGILLYFLAIGFVKNASPSRRPPFISKQEKCVSLTESAMQLVADGAFMILLLGVVQGSGQAALWLRISCENAGAFSPHYTNLYNFILTTS